MPERGCTQRLFFALWPDEVTRKALALLQETFTHQPGRPVAAQNLHITLAFIGNVDGAMKNCMQARAETVSFEPFSMILTRLGHFRRSKVTWLGPDTCPSPLKSLVERLNAKLETCGYRPDKRPFSPHLTLLRKAGPIKSDTEITPLLWHIDRFCLVQSSTLAQGAEYRVLRYYLPNQTECDQRPKSL